MAAPNAPLGGFMAGILSLTHADGAESDPVAVVLDADCAGFRAPVTRVVLELADGNQARPRGGPQLVGHDLPAVQPVFDVRAVDKDARAVPLARRFRRVHARRMQIV